MSITDRNLKTFIDYYIYDKKRLPDFLKNLEINDWDVSNVTDMSNTFLNCETFNEPLNRWDVSNVVIMVDMFSGCIMFNQSLNNWDVSNVITMNNMFNGCSVFNQSLNNWNVSKVIDMTEMFRNCRNFNKSLYEWNTISLETEIEDMFQGCPINENNKPRQRITQRIILDNGNVRYKYFLMERKGFGGGKIYLKRRRTTKKAKKTKKARRTKKTRRTKKNYKNY